MADILKLVPKDGDGPESADLATWLRTLADQVENGEMQSKAAAIVFVVDTEDDSFCCRMRRHGLHYLGVIGAFQTMTHDMLHTT